MPTPITTPDLATDTFSPTAPARGGALFSDKKRLAISTASLLLGGGAALAIMVHRGHDKSGPLQPPVVDPPETTIPPTGTDISDSVPKEPVTVPPNAEIANNIHDGMSFAEAFAKARHTVGAGGVFIWNDRAYNTFLREEWQDLSLQQRAEYAQHVLDAPLPVAVSQPMNRLAGTQPPPSSSEPTIMEGVLNDRRVMGIDQDNDGVIDVLVIEGEDGYVYSVVDRTGDDGLDTVYAYDAISEEYVLAMKLDEPVMLTSASFSTRLEDSISAAAVGALMTPTPLAAVEAEAVADSNGETPTDSTGEDKSADDQDKTATDESDEPDQPEEESYEPDGYGDTYVNNASVDDMDDPHQ